MTIIRPLLEPIKKKVLHGLGCGTGRAVSHSRLLFLQVAQMVAIFLGSGATACGIFDDGTNPDIFPAFQLLSDCSSQLDVLALPAPSGYRYVVWQPGTIQNGAGLLQELLQPPTLGSDTGVAVTDSRLVFLQVAQMVAIFLGFWSNNVSYL